jgi:hypothetical protein
MDDCSTANNNAFYRNDCLDCYAVICACFLSFSKALLQNFNVYSCIELVFYAFSTWLSLIAPVHVVLAPRTDEHNLKFL